MSEPSNEQPTYVDTANEAPAEPPPGAPELVPLLQLPRRRRADVVRRLGELRKHQNELPQAVQAGEQPDPDAERTPEQEQAMLDQAAGMFDLLADMEEMLAEVAKDRQAFDAWLSQADDQALTALAGYYLRTFQVGEAQASPAS